MPTFTRGCVVLLLVVVASVWGGNSVPSAGQALPLSNGLPCHLTN
jgi:hypothetical protein